MTATVAVSAASFVELLNRTIPFAGRDDTLPPLMAVEFDCIGDGYLTANATDRYRLAHARVKIADDTEPFKFRARLQDAQQGAKLLKPYTSALTLRVGPSGMEVAAPTMSLRWTPVDGESVDFRGIIAAAQQWSKPRSTAPFGANMSYLGDFAKVVRGNEQVRVTVNDPVKPILIETTDFVGLLMPVRLDGNRTEAFGFEVRTGKEICIGFTPSRDFERKLAREAKATRAAVRP